MNIGRCRRAFSARSTAPRPMIGSELAVHETTMSNSASRAGRSASGKVVRREARAELAGARRVRLATASTRGWRAAKWVATSSIISPAPTNSTLVWRRSSNSCEASRTAAAAMLIECAPISVDVRTSLATANERWNIWCSVRAERAGAVGLAHRLLHLAEDLRLAEDHRVEPAGDAEGVARRRRAFEHVGVRAQASPLHAAHVGQPVDRRRDARSRGRRRRPRCGCRSTRSRLPRPARGARGTPAASSPAARARTRTGRADRAARSCG